MASVGNTRCDSRSPIAAHQLPWKPGENSPVKYSTVVPAVSLSCNPPNLSSVPIRNTGVDSTKKENSVAA